MEYHLFVFIENILKEVKAEMEKNREQLRCGWAVLLERLIEDPELKLSSLRRLCPENVSLTDFLKMVNVGKRCAPAIREYIFAETAYDKAKKLGDAFVEAELAGLEQAVDEKKAEILRKLMSDCRGYGEINADFPLEELIPLIDTLVKNFGWDEKAVVDLAENLWFTARPCEVKPGTRMVKTVDGIEYAFRWCPPGTFTMGSSSDEPDRFDDETQHKVTLTRGFWMLETPVTQEMWKSVMPGGNPSYFTRGQKPVESVSWNKCMDFCRILSTKLGMTVSLPTEAQWEYACRAGTEDAYAGDLDAMAWYNKDWDSGTHSVGQKEANAWGLYDMHGNVWEWCLDVYDEDFYAKSPASDPCNWEDENSDSDRVCRGGGWFDLAEDCRSAFRYMDAPGIRYFIQGFRCVLAGTNE